MKQLFIRNLFIFLLFMCQNAFTSSYPCPYPYFMMEHFFYYDDMKTTLEILHDKVSKDSEFKEWIMNWEMFDKKELSYYLKLKQDNVVDLAYNLATLLRFRLDPDFESNKNLFISNANTEETELMLIDPLNDREFPEYIKNFFKGLIEKINQWPISQAISEKYKHYVILEQIRMTFVTFTGIKPELWKK